MPDKPTLSKELREILCCPKCHGELDDQHDAESLTCRRCSREYGIKEGIPIMLIDEEESD